LGVSVGVNSHPLLHAHIGSALDVGLEVHEVKSALKIRLRPTTRSRAHCRRRHARLGRARRCCGRGGCGQL